MLNNTCIIPFNWRWFINLQLIELIPSQIDLIAAKLCLIWFDANNISNNFWNKFIYWFNFWNRNTSVNTWWFLCVHKLRAVSALTNKRSESSWRKNNNGKIDFFFLFIMYLLAWKTVHRNCICLGIVHICP